MKELFFIVSLAIIYLLDGLNVKPPPYGQLKVTGQYITKLDGTPVQLRGTSLMTTNTARGHPYFTDYIVNTLKCYWNSNIVRAPLGVENLTIPGYLWAPEQEYDKMKIIVDTAIEQGVYVIIDWHAFYMHTDAAVAFFTNVSQVYDKGKKFQNSNFFYPLCKYPHIIYETYNEPDWANTWDELKEYHIKVINAIRANDPNNVIIVATPRADRDIDIAAKSPIDMPNLAYSLHYYTNIPDTIINATLTAIDLKLPIFASETGVCDAHGNGTVNYNHTETFWNITYSNKIAIVEFGLADYPNNCVSFLKFDTPPEQAGNKSYFTEGGIYVNNKLWSTDQGLTCTAG